MPGMALRSTVGKNVRRYRHSATLTQEELAFRAEMDRKYLSQIERGLGNPSLGMLEALGTVLDVHPAMFLLKEGEVILFKEREDGTGK